MMAVLGPEAAGLDYAPDCTVCPDECPAGRPYPWMIYQNAMQLGVYPIQAIVKVGDTPVDIEEGLNAGAWTVGLTQTGNLMGLSQKEVNALKPDHKRSLNERIARQFAQAGAHWVIDGIWDLPSAIDIIEDRLFHGEQP
jgi:phosphonoacetaldehyde hydrolase